MLALTVCNCGSTTYMYIFQVYPGHFRFLCEISVMTLATFSEEIRFNLGPNN